MSRVSLLVAVLAMCACKGPLPLMSGGKLDGPVKPAPASFSFAEQSATIQIETLPDKAPYSLHVTSAIVGDGLYVNAGHTGTQWVQKIEVAPLVRARLGGDVYELKARRVTDAAELDRFAEIWTSRNSWARDPRKLDGEAYVFALEPR